MVNMGQNADVSNPLGNLLKLIDFLDPGESLRLALLQFNLLLSDRASTG